MATFLNRVLDNRNFILYCFLLFIVLRAVLIFFVPITQASDAAWYYNRALSIAAGDGYSEGGYPTAFWPVGYPGFLGALFSVFGKSPLVGQFANLVLAAGSFWLVLVLSRQFFQKERAARLAVLLLAVYPNNVAYTPLLLTEVYFTFLVLLGSYLLLVRQLLALTFLGGIVFGLAALTKPQVLFLPGFLILLQFFVPRSTFKLKHVLIWGGVVYTAMAVVLIPWAIRNTLVLGEPVLISTNGGVTLLTGNNPSADGGYVSNDPLVKQRRFSVRDQVAADRRARDLAIDWIKEHPARFIELTPYKIWHLWSKDGEAEWAYQSGFKDYDKYRYVFRTFRVLNQGYYALLLVGLLLSAFAMRKSWRLTLWPLSLYGYLFFFYLTAISMVFSGQARFHFPVMPWVIMYAAWAITLYMERPSDSPIDSPK